MSGGSREDIMRTLFSEARHGYQFEAIQDWLQAGGFAYTGQNYVFTYTDPATGIVYGRILEPRANYEQMHLYVSDTTAYEWFNNWFFNQIDRP